MTIYNCANGWQDHSTEGPVETLLYKESYRVVRDKYSDKDFRITKNNEVIIIKSTLKEATDYVDALVDDKREPTEDKELRTVYSYGTTKLLQKYNQYSIVYKHNTFRVYENNAKGSSDYIASFVRTSDAELFVKAAYKEKSCG